MIDGPFSASYAEMVESCLHVCSIFNVIVKWGAKVFLFVGSSYSSVGDPSVARGVLLESNAPLSASYAEMVESCLHVCSIFSVISICGMYCHHSWSGLL